MKRIFLGFVLCIAMFGLVACSSSNSSNNGEDQKDTSVAAEQSKGKITIGGKDFTEQLLLSKISSIYLKENGFDVEEASNMGSTVVRSALENGQVDLYWEYTGTALVIYQKQEVETDPDKTYQTVKEIDEENGLVWLDKAEVNNTYALLMRKDLADELGINTISDLANYVNNDANALKFASNAEFYAREDGLKGLEKKYGFKFPAKNVTRMDTGLLYNALNDKQVDVSVGFATDGRIKGFNLVALEDDQYFFPAYNAAPVIRKEVVTDELSKLLNELSAKLNTETMMTLNYQVDVEHKEIAEVARQWLTENGLVK
ncbi:periplasmic glycine betaine/choline-binding (lipo)protein of an ABC-type transport system (osmoprotectant binding protein) [Schinkia azotoformans MEV2011]|uniref:Periplasmic glycine betaine/choline-binding (Lipo)protein of an ABC-type transport system (Osmoprotectant binding protein) n=1 Tax=Schinkia azotoformans MEV2011 TaxID=1348973 RepID=A0A072NHB8_SCHAZ|nr:glycine betaine ABC transporter substrate-binding protein [Schinkia azotoformans]KEF36308.1 periplasmic glycine betaine/choline-binding (lipo)protein of an ABC-type transport system (osmoprotectant binding protein) [Schinkia azotoformans MEV2011]MEC1696701.1 glycine betaine ABC transporter substrate-binding protein [Schinkia azotoformans]MEC1723645.1 glycine betaine ABC transporter substrate-binding protein [Schinkia azotoformans]MEC1743232.1 glycine betaine ABC transporter substrate-binding